MKRAKIIVKRNLQPFSKVGVLLCFIFCYNSTYAVPLNALEQNDFYVVPYLNGTKWGYAELLTGKVVVPAKYDKVNQMISCNPKPFMQVWLDGKTGAYWMNADGEVEVQIPVKYDFVFALTHNDCQYRNKALAVDSNSTYYYQVGSVVKQFDIRLTRALIFDDKTFNYHYYPVDSAFSFLIPMQFKDAKYKEYFWGDDNQLHQLNKPNGFYLVPVAKGCSCDAVNSHGGLPEMGLVLQQGITRKERRKANFNYDGIKIKWNGALTDFYFVIQSKERMSGLVKRSPADKVPKKENLVLLPTFSSVEPYRLRFYNQELWRVKNKDGYGLFYADLLILPPKYDEIYLRGESFILIKNESYGLYVIKDSSGTNNRLIEPQFTSIQHYLTTSGRNRYHIYKASYPDGTFCYISSEGIKYSSN